ncbi:hypothetical protein KIF24_12040 [Micromonospora sp. Llam7]|nr:hypothetical protein [Micromonospora tarapacensis]
MEAIEATGGDPEFVSARHAESAAFMATGHARFTGLAGVCLAPGGSAALGLLGGLDAARRDRLPVLALVADPADTPGTTGYGPGGPGAEHAAVVGRTGDGWWDAGRLFAGVCHRVRRAVDLARVPQLMDEALRAAVQGAGPVCLVLPRHPATGRFPGVSTGGSVDPRLVLDELAGRLPRPSTVTVDGGLLLAHHTRQLRVPTGVAVWPADPSGVPGLALPYALAAKLAAPDRPVVALVADDGMRSHGLAELVTIARRRSAWPDPRLVVLVLNTRSGHPRTMDPARPVTDDVPYAGWARLLGLHGLRVDRPGLVGAGWDEALTSDRPCVLEVVVDPLAVPRVEPTGSGAARAGRDVRPEPLAPPGGPVEPAAVGSGAALRHGGARWPDGSPVSGPRGTHR